MGYKFRQFEIPDRMMAPLEAYINRGEIPGSFLQAVICNDLKDACGQADDENLANLPAFVAFFYNEAPAPCQGSKEAMLKWAQKGGFLGRYNNAKERSS